MKFDPNGVREPKDLKLYISMPLKKISHEQSRSLPVGHIGQFDTIGFCKSGIAILYINGENLVLRPNQIVYSPAGKVRARIALSDDLVIHELAIPAEIEGENVFEFLHLRDGNYIADVPQNLLSLLSESLLHCSNNSYIEDCFFNAANMANIIGIYYSARMERAKNEQKFQKVLDYMEAHISGNVTLPELASIMHMTPNYFISTFKKNFRLSPIAYYNTLRIKQAVNLMADMDLSLTEISEKIGIIDRYYFTKFFKAQCGISPEYFRKALKNVLSYSED